MSRAYNRQGGLSLEAALIMPGLLLMVGMLVCAILTVEAEIKLKGAMDRTAAELSLISPACDFLIQKKSELPAGNGLALTACQEIDAALQEIFPGQEIVAVLSDTSLDLASSAVLGPILQARLDYWLSESESGQPGWLRFLHDRRLYLDWDLSNNQLWLCLAYQLKLPAGSFGRQFRAVVPIWTGARQSSAGVSDDQIWLLDNFSRGQQLRALYGGNLPFDFPVIAAFANGEAISVKSLDLTAPTYSEPEAVRERIRQQVFLLADFQGAVYNRPEQQIEITAESIESRRLKLIIPANSSQPWLDGVLSDLRNEAAMHAVELEIIRHGSSFRYLDEPGQPAGQD